MKSVFNKLLEKYKKLFTESRSYSCAMAYVDEKDDLHEKVVDFVNSIPEEELYVKEEGHGRELEPHTTILYGLHSSNEDEIYESLDLNDDIKATLGKLSFFENDKYNVLKIGVKSEMLNKLNKRLRENMQYTNDFPSYEPHMTVAYLNKEADMSKYDGLDLFEDVEVLFPFVKISAPESEKLFKIKDKDLKKDK